MTSRTGIKNVTPFIYFGGGETTACDLWMVTAHDYFSGS